MNASYVLDAHAVLAFLQGEPAAHRIVELLRAAKQGQARLLLKAYHRLSYADAFAVALAQQEKATLVTGDPEMKPLAALVPMEWLPR